MTTALAPPVASTKPPIEQQLITAQDLFIRRWGEMGQTWGINRTMAEIHALLYITAQPLCTDDVMERLNISRGNASTILCLGTPPPRIVRFTGIPPATTRANAVAR